MNESHNTVATDKIAALLLQRQGKNIQKEMAISLNSNIYVTQISDISKI